MGCDFVSLKAPSQFLKCCLVVIFLHSSWRYLEVHECFSIVRLKSLCIFILYIAFWG